MQLWESIPYETTDVDFNNPCFNVEYTLANILDFGCDENRNYRNIIVGANVEKSLIEFTRINTVFGIDTVAFTEVNFSSQNLPLNQLTPILERNDSFLYISNANDLKFNISLFEMSGQIIKNPKIYNNEGVNISNLAKGIIYKNFRLK